MTNKKLYTRQEFEEFRIKLAQKMARDKKLRKESFELLTKADTYSWIHQTTWLGEPILNLPQDMFAIQEAIFKSRPKFIIEIGVAWGGALLFYSTLMEIIGGEKIIGIDIYIPEDLKRRISSHRRISGRITWINGSSTDKKTLKKVNSIVGDSRDVMVILDSAHNHEHVLEEMRLYSPFVGKGHYLVCSDTIVEYIPEQKHRPRPWGHGNNPKTAIDEFLGECDRFEIDKEIDNKLLLTCNPGGYLKCSKD